MDGLYVFIWFLFILTPLLKEQFGYSTGDIVQRNFYLSIIMMISTLFKAYLSYRIYPLIIMKIKGILTLFLMVALPFLIMNIQSPFQLFLIQALILLIPLENVPGDGVLLGRLPVLRRFTFATFLFASAQALMNIVVAFGLVYVGSYFGAYGLWLITIPVTVAFLCGVFHFDWLDREDEREFQRELEEDEREREEEARFSLTTT